MMLRGRTVPGPDRDDDNWWAGQSSWAKSGTVCAVGLIAVMLVCGGIIAFSARAGGKTVASAGPRPAAPADGPTAAAGALPSGPPRTAATSAVPPDATWLQVGLGALPFSPTVGPTAVRGGVPSGFARTHAGAAMASIQILGRLSWAAQTKASMRAVAVASTTPAAQAVASLTYDPPSDPSVIPAVAGFQVITYSADQAVINVALRFNGTLRVVPATMQWSAGDWKLAGAPGPLGQTSWAAVDDLTGYVLFSGQPTKAGD